MSEAPKTADAKAWADSFAALRALSDEINTGLLALSRNDLQQFEASVAAQQKLCDSLRGLPVFNLEKLRALAGGLKKVALAAREESTAAQLEKMLALQKELSHLNRVYAHVVVRTQDMFRILLALYKGARQGYSREGKPLSDEHTWSCEA
ncbi:MAG TPA: hypothetical protein VLV49_11915 [Terriglobales bacterium]|nr:hypothetical protein [Terriglobales bacterium]